MNLLRHHLPDADVAYVSLGSGPTPVRPLASWGERVWLKDESVFGDGAWGGNKVRKLEWILPDAHRREAHALLTVGGIGTHWGLAAALYGREQGLETVLALVDQPVDDHVRDQMRRLEASGAHLYHFESPAKMKMGVPRLMWRHRRGLRFPYYVPAGGSSPIGTLGYIETGLEIGAQVRAGEIPEPEQVVTAVGSAGTAAGLAIGLRLAGLSSRVIGVVVNDAFRLDATVIAKLANLTLKVLRERGANTSVSIRARDVSATKSWMGQTYGASTPESLAALVAARDDEGLELEPVYTAKAFAAARQIAANSSGSVLVLNTHGPRAMAPKVSSVSSPVVRE